MASLRDCKSSNLPRVTGISFLLFKWDVAWRNFEVHPLKKLANRIHVSIFRIFFLEKTYGLLSDMAAATLWNSLNVRDRSNRIRGSPSLESFKSNLKTLLFKEHFYPFSS